MKARLCKAFKFLIYNPVVLWKHICCRVKLRRFPINQVTTKAVNGVLFIFDPDFDPEIAKMFHGCYEIGTTHLIRKLLKPGDTFIDVGANIGYITAFAAGLVGSKGQVHSFEPVRTYFERLAQIPRDNPTYTIIANNTALGESEGTAQIAISREQNIGWNTMVPGFMAADAQKETQEVSVSRLDDYLKAKSIEKIALIKIDTEGFELPVLRGLSRHLQNTAHRPAILCEIAPAAYQLMNSSLRDLEEYLRQWGYNSFTLVDTGRSVVLAQLMETTNVLIRKR